MTRTWQDSTGREVCDLEFEGTGVDRFISKEYLGEWLVSMIKAGVS